MSNECMELMEQVKAVMTAIDSKNVVIIGHINADGDCVGTVMGLAHFLGTVTDYNIYPVLAAKTDKGPKSMAEKDAKFHPFEEVPISVTDKYCLIACDTAVRIRLEGREWYENAAATIVIDHHRLNETYGEHNYVKYTESCAEYLYSLVNWDDWKAAREKDAEFPTAIDYIYLGMLHDTERFKRIGPETFDTLGAISEMGMNHREVLKTFQAYDLAYLLRQGDILKHTRRALGGKVAYIFLTKEECEANGFDFEDIHPLSGMLRDCTDVQVSFTMFEETPGVYRCSFRSDGELFDVNELLLPFGGGGHKGAAGMKKEIADPEKEIAEIIARIEYLFGEQA